MKIWVTCYLWTRGIEERDAVDLGNGYMRVLEFGHPRTLGRFEYELTEEDAIFQAYTMITSKRDKVEAELTQLHALTRRLLTRVDEINAAKEAVNHE